MMMMLRLLCYFLLVTSCYLGQATGGFPAPMTRIAATPDERNKKVIADMLGLAVDDDMVLKKQGGLRSTRWELREIPLGPNPMHHHETGPRKKPQTP